MDSCEQPRRRKKNTPFGWSRSQTTAKISRKASCRLKQLSHHRNQYDFVVQNGRRLCDATPTSEVRGFQLRGDLFRVCNCLYMNWIPPVFSMRQKNYRSKTSLAFREFNFCNESADCCQIWRLNSCSLPLAGRHAFVIVLGNFTRGDPSAEDRENLRCGVLRRVRFLSSAW